MAKTANSAEPLYQLIGSEESPYSVKVRAYLRYKSLPHQWLSRAEATELYQQHARLPLIPLLITPTGEAMQDSTPIIEALEADVAEPSIHPADPICRFLSCLLEEFGDEWGNKWMFHYRWAREVDQQACSKRLAKLLVADANEAAIEKTAVQIRTRMVDRVWFVGSSMQTAQQIEESFKDTTALLDSHLAIRPYLFGARPAFADFALWGQLYNANRDPTPHEIIRTRAPHVLAWIERMNDPLALGDFERWNTLSRTLQPLFSDQVGGLFLPWSQANAVAIAADEDYFSVRLRNGLWQQRPQKYHARSLAQLRQRYAECSDNTELAAILSDANCLEFLL